MAIAFRSANSIAYGSRTNTTVTAPAGIVDGDILILCAFTLHVAGGSSTMTPPAGFAAVTLNSGTNPRNQTNGAADNIKMWAWWKRATSEAGDYTITHTVDFSQAMCLCISGAIATGEPTDAAASNGATGQTSTGPSITTTVADTLLVYLEHDWGDTTNNLSPPTGMTERVEVNPLIYAATEAIAAVGATGTRSQTNNCSSGANSMWDAFMIALKPATGVSITPHQYQYRRRRI